MPSTGDSDVRAADAADLEAPLFPTLHGALARWARSRPDAPALHTPRGSVTYAELDRAADAGAAALAAAGVAPGMRVAIVLPRGMDVIVALLAVLKAGAAYGVLELDWPRARRREALALFDAPTVVDRPLPPPDGTSLDPGSQATGPGAVDGADPACVFFTSGTTGAPKGVLAAHRAVTRLFGPGGVARFGVDTVIPLAAPPSWDAFALELWAALLHGGTGVVIEEPFLSAVALRAAVARHGVDTAWLTSSLFNRIVDDDPAAFDGLGLAMIGGERLSPGHIARFLEQHPDVALLNGYGPVESTVFATTHRILPEDCRRADGIPLGRPVPGTAVHVLDGDRVCGPGEPGEICVAGVGLVAGYIDDPARTAERFPRVAVDGRSVRVYRSGDLGRWGEDGLLHYRGRADRQVKVRGLRVEPAEVEAQIERLVPGVRACRVVPQHDAANEVRGLVAFCVPTRPGYRLADALPALRTTLLPHHRPSALIPVAELPLTGNGKLDERALLALLPAGPDAQAAGTTPPTIPPPADPVLAAVVDTVAGVLGHGRVDAGSSVFDIGASSLDAGTVSARLSAWFGHPVPVSVLYAHPTPAALAAWLRDTRPEPVLPGPAHGGMPLPPLPTVYLVRQLADPDDLTGHCLLVWRIDGPVDRAALRRAVDAVHQRHESLRAAYVLDAAPAVHLVDVPPPPVELLPDAADPEAAVASLRAALAEPLDITSGEVWRVALGAVRGTAVAVLGCVVHHVAFDGRSESVLATELSRFYGDHGGAPEQAVDDDPPPSLAATARQRALRRAYVDLGAQRAHVRHELSNVPELRWPPGPRGTGLRHRASTLPVAAVAAIDATAAAAGVTRFTVLLALFAHAVVAVTGQRDFAVGVPVAERGAGRRDRAIGCHLDMLCVRVRGGATAPGPDGLRAVATTVRDALAAQDVSFLEAVELAGAARSARLPLFQTLFALQDNPPPELRLGPACVRHLRQPYLDLPLDLHVEVWPDADGGLRTVVSHRADAVPDAVAEALAADLDDRMRTPDPARR